MGGSAERRARVLIDLAPLRRSRDLRLLVLGELVSVLGTQLTTVAVPYQVYQLTHSSLDVGLVSLAQLFPLIGGALLGGSVVDAMDRRRLLMLAQVLMAGCSAGLAVNADLGTSLWPLFVLPALGRHLRKSRTLDTASADRDPSERCHRVGTRNTCSVYGGFGHLQQCSRLSLSTLGGGGNRTRVLQCITRASPGAACCAFLSPGDHASKTPTGSAAVRCPA